MMNLSLTITVKHLWDTQQFQKSEWGFVNFLVGPNGTGKTLFAEQLKQQCNSHNLKPRYLNAERLAGMEKQEYGYFGTNQMSRGFDISHFGKYKSQGLNYGLSSAAFVVLKEKLDARIRIEATLSQLFHRRIRLVEQGGFMVPKVQRILGGDEYGLKESECHGLKELITLLTFLYDDEYNYLIIDEPELHLHPQFQTLFLQEVRALAGDPRVDSKKKCFFFITHSPYFVDVRTIDDLKNCVVFQPAKLPRVLTTFDAEDEWRIKRLLPRLNTHHKQFFFASRPIFVEGYFDQQIFTLIQERRGKLLGASGACIIDVGGKDELDLYFRLCRSLDIDAQVIADLDALFTGKLRQTVAEDERCKVYLRAEGVADDVMKMLGEMERTIDECLQAVEGAGASPQLKALKDALSKVKPPKPEPGVAIVGEPAATLKDEQKATDDQNKKRRYACLIDVLHFPHRLADAIPACKGKIDFILGRLSKTLAAFKKCGVHFLTKGELENHLPGYTGNPYSISDGDKQKVFEIERAFILDATTRVDKLEERYASLVGILDEVSQPLTVNMDQHLNYVMGDWIHRVQSAVRRGEVTDQDTLTKHAQVEWAAHARILELCSFTMNGGSFVCTIQLKPLIDTHERQITFDNATVAANFTLPPPAKQA